MTAYHPVVQPLSRTKRRFLFLAMVAFFVCAVPVFVFYATGYRYDFWAQNPTITATGGLYVAMGNNDTAEVYMNDERVDNGRLFRKALYIQNIDPGVQRVHVQSKGYQTWVKELPVYPYIVTEAAAFLLPERPQVRPIAEYTTSTGTPIFLGVGASTTIANFASSSVSFTATTSKATTTLSKNSEYTFVRALFGTTTATSTNLINRVVDEAKGILKINQSTVTGSTTASSSATSTATTTIVQSDFMLFEREGDVFIRYTGDDNSIPYYYCIPTEVELATTTSARYQAQLMAAKASYLAEQGTSSASTTPVSLKGTEVQCRHEIKIDRHWSEVISFQFFPGTTDLILMHRKDGVFVTEVDDRAWQNSQQLYPDSADAVKVDGGRIYIEDDGRLFEALTEVSTI